MPANLTYVEMPFTCRTEDGPIRHTVVLHVEAEYVPEETGDRECPPTNEGFDIGRVFWSDGKTPVALTGEQVDRLEQIMLDNVHAESEADQIWRERDRYTD